MDSVGANSGAAASWAQPEPAGHGDAAPPGSAPALAPANRGFVGAPGAGTGTGSGVQGSSSSSGSGGGLFSIIGIAEAARTAAVVTSGSGVRGLHGRVPPVLLLLGVVAALGGTLAWAAWRRRRLQSKAVQPLAAGPGRPESQSIQLLGRAPQSSAPEA